MRTGQVLRLREPSQRAPKQIGRQAESITRTPQHGFAGRRSEDFTSGTASCMVTDMVKLRKLTQGGDRHFPLWKSDSSGEPVLQTSGLLERVSVFGRFLGYQIVPNFTNFYQKRAAKGVRTGSKRQLTGGFLRALYFNRVKSGMVCQAIIGGRGRVCSALPEGKAGKSEGNMTPY